MKKGKKIWKKEMRSSRLLALCMAAVLLFTLPESLPGLYAQESTCRIRLPRQEGVRYQYEEKRVTLEENGGQDLYLEYTPGERVELQILTEGSLERAEFFGTEQSPWKTFETGRISFTMPDQDLELQVTWNREESERTDQVSKQEPGVEPGTALELGLEETGSGSELAMEQKPETEREPGAAIASGTGEKTEMGSNAGKETELEGNTQSRPEQEADSEERAETEQKGSTASETEPGTNTEEGEETEGSTEADSEPEVDTEEEAETETEGSTEAGSEPETHMENLQKQIFYQVELEPMEFCKGFLSRENGKYKAGEPVYLAFVPQEDFQIQAVRARTCTPKAEAESESKSDAEPHFLEDSETKIWLASETEAVSREDAKNETGEASDAESQNPEGDLLCGSDAGAVSYTHLQLPW